MAHTNENKTRVNDGDARAFVAGVENDQRRSDAEALLEIFGRITGEPPRMWGDSIIGYGSYDYTYASGRSGSWMKTGFSPRKGNMSLYIMAGFDQLADARARLGKHKVGKSCLYINKLTDVDPDVLEQMITASYKQMTQKYG